MASLSTLLRLAAILFVLAVTCSKMASSCSCMLTHPQDQACRADFIIVARVKSYVMREAVYKIKVKRAFKMSEKATLALQDGRLATSMSSCAVDLKPEQTYLITGNVISGQARVNMCHFTRPWKQVTKRQRKGFRLLYKHGCNCKIAECYEGRSCPVKPTTCNWVTSRNYDVRQTDCQSDHSVCTRHAGGACAWLQDPQYRDCMKIRRRNDRGQHQTERPVWTGARRRGMNYTMIRRSWEP